MKKLFTGVAICSITGVVIYFFLTPQNENKIIKTLKYQENIETITKIQNPSILNIKEKKKSNPFNQSEVNIINNWFKKQGYMTSLSSDGKFYPSGNQGYLHYDKHTLLKMAKNGDSIAAHTLGEKFISDFDLENKKSNQEISEIENTLLEATARGITTSLDQLILIKTQQYINSWDRKQRKFNNDYIIDAYAYLNILKIRRGFDTIPREYSLNMTKKLNASEYALATSRSEQIYNLLTAQRTKFGLGPFDNNTPPETQALLQRMFSATENGEIK